MTELADLGDAGRRWQKTLEICVPGQAFLWDGLLYGTVRLNGAAVAGAWRMLTTQTLPRRTRAALLFRAVATSRNSPKFSSKVRPTVFTPIPQIWRFVSNGQTSPLRCSDGQPRPSRLLLSAIEATRRRGLRQELVRGSSLALARNPPPWTPALKGTFQCQTHRILSCLFVSLPLLYFPVVSWLCFTILAGASASVRASGRAGGQ